MANFERYDLKKLHQKPCKNLVYKHQSYAFGERTPIRNLIKQSDKIYSYKWKKEY